MTIRSFNAWLLLVIPWFERPPPAPSPQKSHIFKNQFTFFVPTERAYWPIYLMWPKCQITHVQLYNI